MATGFLLGVDFGGGGTKATLLSTEGRVVATSMCEYPTYRPANGWTEQDPEEVYQAFCHNTRTLLADSAIDARSILAICLDGATHTAVLLDEDGAIVRNSIYWTDRRSQEQSNYLNKHHYQTILEKTCNVASPLWTLPQLMWLHEHEPAIHGRIRHVLFMKDYIRYRLTGVMATDSIEAMGAMLLDLDDGTWSPLLCSLASLVPEQLPSIVDPSEVVGCVTDVAAKENGLICGIPVVAGASDTVMEVFASGTVSQGQATVKLATAGRICVITDTPVRSPLLVTYKHLKKGLWYPGTATKSCAASFRWYRDVFGDHENDVAKASQSDTYLLLDQQAATIPLGSDHLYFHPYLQGEATPYMDNNLRGSFTGVTSYHSKAHFTRAVLEGVAFSLYDSLQVLVELGLGFTQASIIGGGAKSPLWRQIVADVLGVKLVKMRNDDSSFGSAMFAGVSIGVFPSCEACLQRCTEVVDTTVPDADRHASYKKHFANYKRIHDALAPLYGEYAAWT